LYQSVIEQLLESREWREVAVGLIAATGRRATEILKTAEFNQIGQFEVKFSGQLKAKGEERKPYPTFTLLESNKVCDALFRLRRMPEIKELKKKTLAEIDSGCNTTINRLVVEKFSPIIQPPTGELQLSTKNLRASYAAIAIYLFCPWNQEPSQFITEKLGHTSDATASNYQDYQVVDNSGKPLTRGAWVERIGEKMTETTQQLVHTSRMLVAKEVRDALSDQDFLPFPDYASRMEELLRLAKIGKQFESGELVKEVVVEKVVEKIVEVPVEKVVEVDPRSTNKRSAVEKPAPAKYNKRPEEMTNEELFGANLPNSGHEKIRRAVTAVKSYNENCGGDKGGMWAINIRTLKDLTNCRTEVVDKYFRSDEGIEELGIRFQISDSDRTKVVIGYNEMLGLGRYHNRGRGSISEVIKLK
ncbi:MAG: protelomerase family protein, partial [Xenococcus sp. MO_188.B8]|nr:protelomerase family protein [Xenococcus sp. MO_188.B8]